MSLTSSKRRAAASLSFSPVIAETIAGIGQVDRAAIGGIYYPFIELPDLGVDLSISPGLTPSRRRAVASYIFSVLHAETISGLSQPDRAAAAGTYYPYEGEAPPGVICVDTNLEIARLIIELVKRKGELSLALRSYETELGEKIFNIGLEDDSKEFD